MSPTANEETGTDLVTDLAASMFLSLFSTPLGGVRDGVERCELQAAVAGTGAKGVRAAGAGGAALICAWERAGLVAVPDTTRTPGSSSIRLLPRGQALAAGPFRWDRLNRALRCRWT